VKVPPLPGTPHHATLDSGLEVLVLENRQAPIVTSALTYRVGARNDPAGQAGLAHFLEHMMFKGSAEYAAGEIDAITQRLGGDSNAMTWHDATLYYFQFASDRWTEALSIEADRMRGLRLDSVEVDRERSVILEEIAAADDDPWQLLEQAVHGAFFGDHPYARPILGSAAELEALGRDQLEAWHRAHYHPRGGLLTIAGDVGPEAIDQVARAFEEIGEGGNSVAATGGAPAAPARSAVPGRRMIDVHQGKLEKWLAVLPAPHPDAADFAAVRMAAALLGLGRLGRLQRELVDEDPLLMSVSCTVLDTLDSGCVSVTAEPRVGVGLDEVEARVFSTMKTLATDPPRDEELARVRNLLISDWMFAHETIGDQALTAGFAAACLELDRPHRQMEAIVAVDADAVAEVAESWLSPDREVVVGRCLPLEPV